MPVSAAFVLRAKELTDAGMSLLNAGKVLGRSKESVRRALLGAGLWTKCHWASVPRKAGWADAAVGLYAEGFNTHEIAAKLDYARSAVWCVLKERGVTRTYRDARILGVSRGHKMPAGCNEAFFESWTPDSAWVLGLIFSDGWLDDSQFSVSGSFEVVSKVKALTGSTNKIQKTKTCHVLTVGSKKICSAIAKTFGICGEKSRTMLFPATLPDSVVPHYIRGLWDGDGSFEVRKDRWLYASYFSASKEFVEGLRDSLARLAGTPPDRPIYHAVIERPGKTFHGYSLRYTTEQSKSLSRWLYADSVGGNRCSKRFLKVTRFLNVESVIGG